MKIKELYLKSFGKFSERRFSFGDGVNVVYGNNETGKTTVYTAIGALLFGLERQRGRASQTDSYKTYQPWEYPTLYAGSMKFETGGKIFRIDRNFYQNEKSARLLCETDGEELSVEQGDLHMLLGEITEELFFNTAAAGQLQMKPKDIVYDYLKNYIVNLQESGGSGLDVIGALESLEKRQKELERQKKKQEGEIRQQIAALEAKAVLVGKEISDCQEQICRTREQREAAESLKKKKKSGFFAVVLSFLKRLFFGKRYRKEKAELRGQKKRLQEREEFLRELSEEKAGLLAELEQEREELFAKLHEQEKEEEIRAIELAKERIRRLSSECREEVMEKLLKEASNLLYRMTDGKYQKIILKEKSEPEVWDGREVRKLFQLSTGCTEQIYLSVRIAMQDLFFGEEKMPLIFDDAFAYFDEERLERLLACLAGLDRQVILLTCHTREAFLLEKRKLPFRKIIL